jgi:hypothetical protein
MTNETDENRFAALLILTQLFRHHVRCARAIDEEIARGEIQETKIHSSLTVRDKTVVTFDGSVLRTPASRIPI